MAGRRRAVGRLIAFGIVTGFVILAIVVVERVVRHPQTDDAVVTADIIGVVPQVSGTITELHVKDNQRVKQVGDLEALRAKRDAALAARGKAELDLDFCYVRAPFDALVVNLHTAIGAFVAPGPVPVFSLVDTRAWYVMANYRETEFTHIAPGMEAEVYVLTNPHYHFRGSVQGIGWAVNPEDQPISPGVPPIKRELNWVHIAQRFPVRIRVENPEPPDVFRVGASAVAIIRGWPADRPVATPE